jgi:hypothetical protein
MFHFAPLLFYFHNLHLLYEVSYRQLVASTLISPAPRIPFTSPASLSSTFFCCLALTFNCFTQLITRVSILYLEHAIDFRHSS